MASAGKRLDEIEQRNKRVEADKAWETSMARRLMIGVLTYSVILVLLIMIGAPNPFFIALVPAIGFALSTLTLSVCKVYWIKRFYRKSV